MGFGIRANRGTLTKNSPNTFFFLPSRNPLSSWSVRPRDRCRRRRWSCGGKFWASHLRFGRPPSCSCRRCTLTRTRTRMNRVLPLRSCATRHRAELRAPCRERPQLSLPQSARPRASPLRPSRRRALLDSPRPHALRATREICALATPGHAAA